ncbi:MAG: multicopper oxidase domain-containing protein, partial [Ferruginibacter sp.]
MKFLILVRYIVLFLAFYPCTINATAQKMEGMNVETESKKPSYTCPMHPDVHSDKPGKCPKCGMSLVEEKPKEVMQMNGMDMHNNIKADTASVPQKYIYNNAPPKVTHYDLYIKDTIVNFSGNRRRAIAANGQIPMPPLTFTEGDTAEIVVHNLMKEGTTLHWHGLFLDNQYDGVANLTQKPIPAGGTFTYRFPIKQSGTHWYHSHFMLQEQIGMYGSMTLLSRKELDIPTIPVILSEWSDVKPEEIHRRLYAASDWFAIQKGTTQSYGEALVTGHFKTKLKNEWKRMHA